MAIYHLCYAKRLAKVASVSFFSPKQVSDLTHSHFNKIVLAHLARHDSVIYLNYANVAEFVNEWG